MGYYRPHTITVQTSRDDPDELGSQYNSELGNGMCVSR